MEVPRQKEHGLTCWASLLESARDPDKLLPFLTGTTFSTGWWLFIDAVAYQTAHQYEPHVRLGHWVPGLVATGAFAFTYFAAHNSMRLRIDITGQAQACLRLWLFLGFCLSLGSVMWAVALMATVYGNTESRSVEHGWPGLAMVAQTALIFFASFLHIWHQTSESSQFL